MSILPHIRHMFIIMIPVRSLSHFLADVGCGLIISSFFLVIFLIESPEVSEWLLCNANWTICNYIMAAAYIWWDDDDVCIG